MKSLLYIIVLILIISCDQKQDNLQEIIFKDVINETYLTLTHDFTNLLDTNEVLVNPFNDKLDSLAVLGLKNQNTLNLNTETLDLLNKLETRLNESINVNFKKLTKGKKFQLIDNKAEIDTYDFSKIKLCWFIILIYNRN